MAQLGVLKSGAAFVPLDTKYPAERLRLMLDDTCMPLLITERTLVLDTVSTTCGSGWVRSLHAGVEEISRRQATHPPATAGGTDCVQQEIAAVGAKPLRTIYLDDEHDLIALQSVENPAPAAEPENLAYAIYTSGSTGKPKGVLIEHRSLSNVTAVLAHDFRVQPESRILQFFSFSFDPSVLDVTIALSSGATLCLASKESLMPGENLLRTLREQGITSVHLPPSALAVMAPEELPQLQTLMCGGEVCTADLVRRWSSPGRRLLNAYGPTETTILVTFSECLDKEKAPPIGHAIGGTEIYVLDSRLRPVPVGVPGEVYIGGVVVARGYLNRPRLTAEKFIPHPFSQEPGARLYRTGDKARLLPNGEIDYLGRIDEQLKVRGFRIEPGEIENVLRQLPCVHEALVAAREVAPGDKRLIAYIVKRKESSASVSELRGSLRERLPEYMIPSAFIFLEEIPLTPQGKYDRRALPTPHQARFEEGGLVAPRDVLELQLTEQWEELLRVSCGVTDDFFELGGHSLLAVQLMSRIEKLYGKKIPLA
ncbi:MAG TPA: amino acid adenylation domain-containing protein, partial [Pyrinomonadaceae bacterium]